MYSSARRDVTLLCCSRSITEEYFCLKMRINVRPNLVQICVVSEQSNPAPALASHGFLVSFIDCMLKTAAN